MVKKIGVVTRVVCLLAFLLSFGWAAAPASASASGLLKLHCLGTSSITYSPGLTNTPQLVTITSDNDFPHCESLADPTIESASFPASVTNVTRSCTDLLNPGVGSRTIVYNTDNTSTYTATRKSNYLSGQLAITNNGTVTGGQFFGSGYVGLAIYVVADFYEKCNELEGITSMSGTFTINISL